MKTVSPTLHLLKKYANTKNIGIFPLKINQFYNDSLDNQTVIEKLNQQRPNIFLYTDFGGGKNFGVPLIDVQTSEEIASAGWKATLNQKIYINDSASPLQPLEAALHLAKTFPYKKEFLRCELDEIRIHTIVVHVIDPGVGNHQSDSRRAHPRSLVLRKDGTLFIGPDNGTLAYVCPDQTIAGIWEIDTATICQLSGIDTDVGGTFHGRDLFCEAAFRIACGEVSLDDIGIPYTKAKTKINLFSSKNTFKDHRQPIAFVSLKTERFDRTYDQLDENEHFAMTFLLGIIQSPLYEDKKPVALTRSKKLFILTSKSVGDPNIAIVNEKTGNSYIGPNNGLGTSFFKDYSREDITVFNISEITLDQIRNEKNNELARLLIQEQSLFKGLLEEEHFLGSESDLKRDTKGRPKTLQARIWIDLYGNIKTTLQSPLLDEVKALNANVKVFLNSVEKSVIFAETFSQVSENDIFIYNGSTATIGPNPHRSKRYVELSTNGTFGKFGIDCFTLDGKQPKSGQAIRFDFEYNQ